MDDPQIHGTIEKLVAEEHELWQRESAGAASEADRRRLQELRVSLDQCWTSCVNAAPCARLVVTRTRPMFGRQTWSSATSSSSRSRKPVASET